MVSCKPRSFAIFAFGCVAFKAFVFVLFIEEIVVIDLPESEHLASLGLFFRIILRRSERFIGI